MAGKPHREHHAGHAHGGRLQPPGAARVRSVRIRGVKDVVAPQTQKEVDLAIREGKAVVTDDAFLLARSPEVDVLVDVTGSVEFGARVAFEAFRHGKDVVLLNAEIDATIGPILQVYARQTRRDSFRVRR